MRIRPSLRLACAAAACALAVGLGAASPAWSQSLIEALSTTYNSNPDLLASRAMLRQTDETLAQAVANWRPQGVAVGRIQQDRAGLVARSGRRRPSYALNGRFTTLQMVQPIFRGGKTVADTKAAQANIQAQRALLADTEQNGAAAAVDLLRRSASRTSASSTRARTTSGCWCSSSTPRASASASAS